MRNFIKDVNPEIKFRFYEDKTEDENYCACVIRTFSPTTRIVVPVPNPR